MYELTEASVEVSSRPVNPPHPSSSTSMVSVVRSSPQVTPSSPLWPEHSPIAHLPFSAPSLPAIGYIEGITYLSAYSLKHIVRTSLTPPTTPRSLPQAINHPPPTRLDSTQPRTTHGYTFHPPSLSSRAQPKQVYRADPRQETAHCVWWTSSTCSATSAIDVTTRLPPALIRPRTTARIAARSVCAPCRLVVGLLGAERRVGGRRVQSLVAGGREAQ